MVEQVGSARADSEPYAESDHHHASRVRLRGSHADDIEKEAPGPACGSV